MVSLFLPTLIAESWWQIYHVLSRNVNDDADDDADDDGESLKDAWRGCSYRQRAEYSRLQQLTRQCCVDWWKPVEVVVLHSTSHVRRALVFPSWRRCKPPPATSEQPSRGGGHTRRPVDLGGLRLRRPDHVQSTRQRRQLHTRMRSPTALFTGVDTATASTARLAWPLTTSPALAWSPRTARRRQVRECMTSRRLVGGGYTNSPACGILDDDDDDNDAHKLTTRQKR